MKRGQADAFDELRARVSSCPSMGIAATVRARERVRLQEWLNFTSSELHKALGPYFSGRNLEDAEKERVDANLARRIGEVERVLAAGRSFILGQSFTVADAYLFVVLNWTNFIGFDLAKWPHVAAYLARLAGRPAVRAAMSREGLIQEDAA